ncbi:MAG TPA: hypothetical protein VFD48_10805 [Pyrinomonadaceae bacterium]|nr:hypothetical protein [Pyrinomonadaceae bacterium]
MNWIQQAKIIFNVPKPLHFCNYQHCCECAEHDQTLLHSDVDSIGLEQLGNPGWDPLCFCSPEGLLYYMPAIVRITLDTMEKPQEMYLDQMLFHLIHDGMDNRIVTACSEEQREFVAGFLQHLVENYASEIEAGFYCSDDILKAHAIWNAPKT